MIPSSNRQQQDSQSIAWGWQTALRLVIASLLGGTLLLILLVALMAALAPPYLGPSYLLSDFSPSTLWLPLQTTVFRRAIVNTAALALGVGASSLLLGWLWAKLGWPRSRVGGALLLLPCLLSGAAAGLLWRPWLEPGLVFAQAEVNLALMGLVMVWQATPLVAWWLDRRGVSWRSFGQALSVPLVLVLLSDGLPLLLTGGEPFNASQTWASWSLHTLWVTRNWGEAATMRYGLAIGVSALLLIVRYLTVSSSHYKSSRVESSQSGSVSTPQPSRQRTSLRLIFLSLWSIGPFVLWLPVLLSAPLKAWAQLVQAGAPMWFIWWAVVIIGSSLVAHVLVGQMTVGKRMSWWGTVLIPFPLALAPVMFGYLNSQFSGAGQWLGRGYWLILPLSLTLVLCLVAWPCRSTRQVYDWHSTVAVALLITAQGFGLELMMDASAWWTLPATGLSQYSAVGAPYATAWLLLLHGMVAWVGGYMLTYDDCNTGK